MDRGALHFHFARNKIQQNHEKKQKNRATAKEN